MYHERPLLILDLDETLIHASDEKLSTQTFITTIIDWNIAYYVYKRPNLKTFLDFCFEHFDVAVWTAASKSYAEEVVPLIFGDKTSKLKFIFSGERCVKKFNPFSEYETTGFKIKDLKKVWKRRFHGKRYSRFKTLIIDDTKTTFIRNYGNAINVIEWSGSLEDMELLRLIEYLKYLLETTIPWRSLEKRHWRSNY
jgi:RNA polymerase II subunit A small phosphatase-like protein